MPGWTAIFAVLAWSPAHADCDEPVSLERLVDRSVAVDGALAVGSNLEARDEARRLRDELPCLAVVLPDEATVAAIARAIGAGYVASGEVALGRPWLRTAHDLASYEWRLADDHPVLEVWRQIEAEPIAQPERASDQSFVAEARLDGRAIDDPVALPDRPHVLQIGDDPAKTFIVFGARFPSEVFRRRRSGNASKSKSSPLSDEPLVVKRLRPPEKTPLLVAGGALVVVAGGLYALAGQRRQRFDDPLGASSIEELTGLRNQVNGLVIASAATLALGVSGTTWGTLVGSRGSATLRIRF